MIKTWWHRGGVLTIEGSVHSNSWALSPNKISFKWSKNGVSKTKPNPDMMKPGHCNPHESFISQQSKCSFISQQSKRDYVQRRAFHPETEADKKKRFRKRSASCLEFVIVASMDSRHRLNASICDFTRPPS